MKTALKALLAAVVLLFAVGFIGVRMGDHDPIDLVPIAEETHGIDFESRMVETAPGVRLHVVSAGPAEGELVVLLHGFPEFWWTWHEQMAALARAGYRVLAPDLRGFNASDKPGEIDAYRSEVVWADVTAVIADAGKRSAFIAGHDFGAALLWNLAIHEPQWVRRMVVFNVSHPLAHTPAEVDTGEQVNWFRTFFQLPRLPELVGPFGDWWLTSWYLRNSSRAGTFAEPVMSYYKQAWSRPSAFGSMVHWYRAVFRHPLEFDPEHRIAIPTKIVFGAHDIFNEPGSGETSLGFCTRCEFVNFENAGHWILHEEPEATSALLLDHFRSP